MTRSEATKSTAAEQLVDIRDVKIDRSLPSEERIKSFIEQIKNPYQFKVGNEIILPFKNLINDSYSRDISIKIRSNLETKRRNGEFVGSHVVYGYRRSDDDKNKLVIDQTVAPVIQSIFSMKMDGFSPAQIADKLNKDGVPSPYEYKRQSGSKYQSGFKKQIQTDWGAKAIYRILKNEMYTGTLVQGKTTTPNHKIKSRTTKDEADWMRTENAHLYLKIQLVCLEPE